MEVKVRLLVLINLFLFINHSIVAASNEVYITTPEIFAALNLSQQIGTKQFPLISISQALFNLAEGQSHQVFISPHKHFMDCLNCSQCLNGCEIMRGGAQRLNEKIITIQTYENCSSQEEQQEMCLNHSNMAEIQIKNKSVGIQLQSEYLKIKNIKMIGQAQQEKAFINAFSSQIELVQVEVMQMKESFAYLSDQSQMKIENCSFKMNQAKFNGGVFFLRNSIID